MMLKDAIERNRARQAEKAAKVRYVYVGASEERILEVLAAKRVEQ